MSKWGALSELIDDQLADDIAAGTLTQEGGHRGSANTAVVAYLKQELDRLGEDELRRRMQEAVEHYEKQGSYSACINVLFNRKRHTSSSWLWWSSVPGCYSSRRG
ncbi:MAG: hypothetical protein ABGZ23_12560 [Fuerstiella sp.]